MPSTRSLRTASSQSQAWQRTSSRHATPMSRISVQNTPFTPPRHEQRAGAHPAALQSYDTGADDDEGDDRADHVILALDKTAKNTIGCAYYIAREGSLHCMEDVVHSDDSAIEALKVDINPTIVLVSPRIDSSAVDLARANSLDPDDIDGLPLPYRIELRPTKDFRYDLAIAKLASIKTLIDLPGVRYMVPGSNDQTMFDNSLDDPEMTNLRGLALRISTCVNLDSKVSIGCAGALMVYLQQRSQAEYLLGDQADSYTVSRLETFSLKDTMLVNSDTLAALQIVQPESHPNSAQQGPGSSGAKESLSVFGLFQRFAGTPQGKQRLRHLFLHPSTDIDVVKERHQAVSVFLRLENEEAVRQMSKAFRTVKDMKRYVAMLHRGIEGGTTHTTSIKSNVWNALLDFCVEIGTISQVLSQTDGVDTVPWLPRYQATFAAHDFQDLGKTIYEVVDLEESHIHQRTVLKRGVDLELDTVKDRYNAMDEALQLAATDIANQFPANVPVPRLAVVYVPQIGYLLTIPLGEAQDVLGLTGLPPDWVESFSTGESVYFRTDKTCAMDHELGDMWASICDREIERSHELAQVLLQHEKILVEASIMAGELDSLLALSNGAAQFNLTRPQMVEDNVIDIRQGRHILQELTVPTFIPNNAHLIGGDGPNVDATGTTQRFRDNPTMLLLTGPNYSGKSMFLKQNALIVYMAQVGSYVPADGATLGITDRIMTRVTSRESVSRGQSSFMIDLQQMSTALKTFTSRSLLVIDEFGKGTDSCDAAGLAAGVITYLLRLGEDAPKCLISTHFHEIFDQGFVREDLPGLALKQMEVHVTAKDKTQTVGNHNSEVAYLYNVKPGRSRVSYATQCAAMNGVPSRIVERACQLNELALAGQDLASICCGVSDEEVKTLEEAEAISRAFLTLNLNDLTSAQVANFKDSLGQLVAENSNHEYSSATKSFVSTTMSAVHEARDGS